MLLVDSHPKNAAVLDEMIARLQAIRDGNNPHALAVVVAMAGECRNGGTDHLDYNWAFVSIDDERDAAKLLTQWMDLQFEQAGL